MRGSAKTGLEEYSSRYYGVWADVGGTALLSALPFEARLTFRLIWSRFLVAFVLRERYGLRPFVS
jgi:hypothetical protein